MADGKLFTSPLKYPTLQAVANAKLGFTKQDRLKFRVKTVVPALIARRASTSDPWTIEVNFQEEETIFTFAKAAVDVSSDALNWKAMADLVLKAHQRPAEDQVWDLIGVEGYLMPFGVYDTTKPTYYRAATETEAKAVLWAQVQETGDINVIYHPTSTSAQLMAISELEVSLVNGISAILANTTDVSWTIRFPYSVVKDQKEDNGATGSSVGAVYTLTDIKGTEGLSIGNYSGGDLIVTYKVPAYNGLASVYSLRKLSAGAVYDTPSIQLDKLRKAASSGQTVTIDIAWMSDTDSFTVRSRFNSLSGIGVDSVLATASVANPDGVYEMDIDQANSLDVLATAAFAGVGGLVAVGTQASLEQILSESFLSTTFGKLAVTLGTTTAALISGYVSALIAAFANNWITSDQLFDLQNHVSWLQQGAANIALAASAGIAVGSIPTLMSYLGVSNNVLSMAMNAVGGAATSAGVALGMASVMSKVVRHTYWGE